tara:strand:- start:134 stop:520 length:387 start_codon:yes stop_codon:yes gene_type:complete
MKEKNLNDFLPDKDSSYYKKLNNIKANESILKKNVINQIKKVMDPEIPVNLYDLGLIYNIDIDSNNNVLINMTLTNPNCPVAGSMPKNVGLAVENLNNLSSVRVNLVWYPKWDKSMMSDEAKLALDIF